MGEKYIWVFGIPNAIYFRKKILHKKYFFTDFKRPKGNCVMHKVNTGTVYSLVAYMWLRSQG